MNTDELLNQLEDNGVMTDNALGCYDWSKYFPK